MKDDTPKVAPGRTVFTPVNCLVVAVIAGISFLILAIWISGRGTNVPGMDRSIHAWVLARRSSVNIKFARGVTWGGVTQIVLPILIIIGVLATEGGQTFTRRLKSGVVITLVAGVGAYLGLSINHLQGRVRPPMADWAGTAGGPSFPSGHTTVATIFAASSAWLIATRVHAGWPRITLWTVAVLYAVAVGFSRVWLGVHWPTDVIGSWLYALTWLAGSAAAVLYIRKRWPRPAEHKS
ncbi:MAG TPA: phosphatase PAP2 family protein [Candidatus Nanopelagicaceae bacterium]